MGGLIFLAVVYIAACSGDDTEVEITQRPEPVEEVLPETTPEPEPPQEPEPDFEYFATLESWGAENGLIDVATDNAGNCVDPLLTNKTEFPPASNLKPYPGEWIPVSGGGPECRDDDNEGSLIEVSCVVDSTSLGVCRS